MACCFRYTESHPDKNREQDSIIFGTLETTWQQTAFAGPRLMNRDTEFFNKTHDFGNYPCRSNLLEHFENLSIKIKKPDCSGFFYHDFMHYFSANDDEYFHQDRDDFWE